jgi:ATP-binding protein involved in chromosome partitioning
MAVVQIPEDVVTATEPQLMEALRGVLDPELHISIVELDMVKGVAIGDRGRVSVTVALTVAGCPMRTEITERVTAALRPLDGVEEVDVQLTVMSEAQLSAVRDKMLARQGNGGNGHGAAGGSGGQPLGHEKGVPNPFMAPGSRTRILGISSGKGGVGKSSVSVNLAVALARAGHSVGILDADVYGFSVPKMLGIDQDPVVIDDMIIPPVAYGVGCISIGFFVGDDQPVMWRGPMLHKALEQFLVDVYWGDPEFLVIDMPPGTGDVALSMSQYLPRSEIYVVTTPQAAAQRVAQRTAFMAKKVNMPLRGVIENMSWFTGDDGRRYELFGHGGGEALATSLGVPLLAQLPLIPALREGGDLGRPITATDPTGEAARAFEGLAAAVVARGATRVFRPELTIR